MHNMGQREDIAMDPYYLSPYRSDHFQRPPSARTRTGRLSAKHGLTRVGKSSRVGIFLICSGRIEAGLAHVGVLGEDLRRIGCRERGECHASSPDVAYPIDFPARYRTILQRGPMPPLQPSGCDPRGMPPGRAPRRLAATQGRGLYGPRCGAAIRPISGIDGVSCSRSRSTRYTPPQHV